MREYSAASLALVRLAVEGISIDSDIVSASVSRPRASSDRHQTTGPYPAELRAAVANMVSDGYWIST